jgi:tetratricopeptide (TPR) repeat protein
VIVMLSKDQAGLTAIDRALAINPSCATALFVGSAANAMMSRPSLALAHATRALRLNPFDLLVSVAHTAKGIASVQEELYEQAAAYHDQSVQANPTLSSFRFFAACAHALAGDLEAGRSLVQEGLAMEPEFRLRFFFELLPPGIAEKFAEGGRKFRIARLDPLMQARRVEGATVFRFLTHHQRIGSTHGSLHCVGIVMTRPIRYPFAPDVTVTGIECTVLSATRI